MRLLPKLTLGILAASVVPLAVAGLSSERLSARALERRIQEDHAALAVNAADGVARFFDAIGATLAIYPELQQLRDLEGPAADAAAEARTQELTRGILALAYRSSEDLAIVALLDERGEERTGSMYLSDPAHARELGGREVVTDADRDAFLARVPLARALAGDAPLALAIGEVTLVGVPPTPHCAVALAFPARGGRYVLAADVSLRRLSERLASISQNGMEVILVDALRRRAAGGALGASAGGPPLAPVALPGDKDPAGPLPAQTAVARVATSGAPGAPRALAAFAPATDTGFGVVVSQPERQAFAHVRGLRLRTLYWLGISAVVALLVGIGLARGVSRQIATLSAGTVTLARGQFDARLDATGGDELAALARAFNKMAADLGTAADEIRHRNQEITGKNEEITRWNQELERRVAEKTRELRQAEELLLRSRSLTAVGTLGAGMAHEINNPLTGVLGAAQLLLLDIPPSAPAYALVKDVELQAQRIRKIVANLLRMAQTEAGEDQQALDLNRVVEDAIELVGAAELAKASIRVARRFETALPAVRGNPVRLQEALIELVTNARRAMPHGGQLTIQTAALDRRAVKLEVSDTGRGIEPHVIDKIFDPFFTTKENWQSTGMGLTLVHKIVEEHRGTIAVASELGRGATFTLTFPSSGGVHLS